MTHALSDPVNLIGEIDEESSGRCVRRIVARVLGHAGLELSDAREIWVTMGFDPELWPEYVPTFQSV